MNWEEISEKYPSSYIRAEHFLINRLPPLKDPFNIRNLYDFFDENGVIVCIDHIYYDGHNFQWSLDFFLYDFGYRDFTELADTDGSCHSRTEAEEAAFEKAFEILEKNVRGNT